MKNLPHVDVAIIGGGWTGLLMAKELGSRTSASVAVLERGGPRDMHEYLAGMDELDYAIRLHMMQDPSEQTVTLRHDMQKRALPIRQYGSFLPGAGVGGAGEHWNGVLNWCDNERKTVEYATAKIVEIAKAMGASAVTPFAGLGNYDGMRYQSTHVQGGAIMGASPLNSVINPYLQHWDLSNLFVLGASSFPQNFSSHPTMTVLAQTYRASDAIIDRYLKHPAPLV